MLIELLEAIPIFSPLVAYFFPPHMEVVEQETRCGRLSDERFVLLLRVRFRNESGQPTLVRSLRLRYGGNWHEPSKDFPEVDHDLDLFKRHGQTSTRLRREEKVTVSPRIPPSDVVERSAIYVLPEPQEYWPASIEATAEATFPRRKSRSVTFTVRA